MKPGWSQELYIKAFMFAAKAHEIINQKVPGTNLPYIVHINLVSMEIMAALCVEDDLDGDLAIQCALLHDVIEDVGIKYDNLKNKFGIKVADGVNALSKNKAIESKEERMLDSLERIKKQPKEVWMVKLADRITNLQPPPSHWNQEKISKYKKEAKLIYDNLKDANKFLADRLKHKIDNYSLKGDVSMGSFSKALNYAFDLHDGQKRKGSNIPYISHLLGVASIVLEYGGNESEAIAALLHDAIEDQGGDDTRTEIREIFGDKVVKIVDGCTDTDEKPKPPWKKRKEDYIEHISGASPSVRLVSAADKLHNARSILKDHLQCGERVWQRFKGGKEGTIWYYRSLVDAYKEAGSNPLIEELERVVTEIEKRIQG